MHLHTCLLLALKTIREISLLKIHKVARPDKLYLSLIKDGGSFNMWVNETIVVDLGGGEST